MKEKRSYLGGLMHGIATLLTGMKITGREFFTKKVTEQYPENRNTLEISPRFRGHITALTFIHFSYQIHLRILAATVKPIKDNKLLHKPT